MPTARRLTAKNVFLFKKAEFDFDFEGISVIRGLNRNGAARDKNAPLNSNFIGKSLFFSQIKDIMLPGAESGKSKDRVKLGETGTSTFEFERNGREYAVARYGHGTSSRMKFTKDGVNVSKSGVTDQNNYVRSLLGMSSTAFEVMHYLDNRIPNPLRTGDTTARKAFFTEFFQLGAADHIRRLITAEKTRLKQDLAVLQELSSLKPSENEVDIAAVQALIAKKTKARDAWAARLEDLRQSRLEWNFRQQNTAVLRDLSKYGDSVAAITERVSSRLRSVKGGIASHVAAQEYTADLKAYQKARSALRAYLAEHPSLADLEKDALLRQVKESRVAVERAKRALDEARLDEEQKSAEVATWQAQVDKNYRMQRALRSSKEQLCELCGTPLDTNHKKAELKKLAKEELRLSESDPGEVDHFTQAVAVAAGKHSKAQARLKRLEDALDLFSNAPSVPDKPEPIDAVVPDEPESELRAEHVKLKGLLAALNDLSSEGTKAFLSRALSGEVIEYSDEDYDTTSDKLNRLSASVAKLEATLEQEVRRVAEEEARVKRIAELTIACENADAIAILDRAFGSSRGVKTIQIKGICGLLESEVNSIASGMFPEKYTFRFDLDTQFNILVTRHLPDKSVTSDVRKLSGAEAGVFDLVMAMALAAMTPEEKRWNFLILDELDSNFSPAMTQSFVSFLPRVAKLFKHVIVITPRLTDYGREDNVRYFTVVKDGSSSKLLPGKVTS